MKKPRFTLPAIPAWQPTVAVVVTILYLTLMPQPLEMDTDLFPAADKVIHFIMFGGLTSTIIFDRWRSKGVTGWRFALRAAIISILLGITVEWLQDTMNLGRAGRDPYDILANTLGALTALPICRYLGWIEGKR